MIRSLCILLLSAFSCLLFSSAVSVTPPDPDTFSKLFIETIKQNNKELFVKTFEITEADFHWLLKTLLENPYQSEVEKARIRESEEKIPETIKEMYEQRLNDFTTLQKWITDDTINANTIELVDFFYEIKLLKEFPFHIIKEGILFIKHGTKFYTIHVDEIVFVNNQWKFGKIKGIQESPRQVDFYLFYMDEDTHVLDDFAPVYDTAAAVAFDTLKAQTDVIFTEKQSKKADKIQQKINALYLKQMNILYKEE